jgi:chorismate-pyruvate lyase
MHNVSPIKDESPLSPRSSVAALLQEALLRTDGTVTELLELFTDETIGIEKVTTGGYTAECHRPKCDREPGLVVRDVILTGQSSGERYIFAHSHLFPEALPRAVFQRLSETSDPIGKVLREYRTEQYRQLDERGCRRMPGIAGILGRPETDQMLWRRYSIIVAGLVIMEIAEVFSEQLFSTAYEHVG